MFHTFIVEPIFNLLVAIYALLPGHNFGLAIIIFTIVVRLLLWPLLKKQTHQVKKMRKIQPELKRIKKAAAGDKRKEQTMMMELYKERGINPLSQIGVMLLQMPILIGLYLGLQQVIKNHSAIVSHAYPFLQNISWMKELAHNIQAFDATLFGVVDLTKSALGATGTYWPAMILVLGSAVVQYYSSKQIAPTAKDSKGLRGIMRDAKEGRQADQAEVNAAMSRSMRFMLPAFMVMITIHLASALSLYWLVSGLVAYIQQARILDKDEEEMEELADSKDREKNAIEAEIVETPKTKKPKNKSSSNKKRRKK